MELILIGALQDLHWFFLLPLEQKIPRGHHQPLLSFSYSSDTISWCFSWVFNLSYAVPAQVFGRCFVSTATVTVSPQLRTNIIQGKDLGTLLLPLPAADGHMVDCGDVEVFLNPSDPRLQHNLSLTEFVIACSFYSDIWVKFWKKWANTKKDLIEGRSINKFIKLTEVMLASTSIQKHSILVTSESH